jgi:hypothetical protein
MFAQSHNPKERKARLDHIKSEIEGHFLAIGKYLMEVRDDELFLEDNQKSFSAWVVHSLGYSKSWASQHLTAYEQNETIIDAGSLPLANITASRKLNHIIQDVQNIDAIAIAMLATDIAKEDNRETLTVDDLNRAYQTALRQYPQPVLDFCEQFNITNPDKAKLITEWYFRGANRQDSKWDSMRQSGKLILSFDDERDDLVLDLATCSVNDMVSFADEWRNYRKRMSDDANPKKQKYVGTVGEIIKKLFAYRHKKARVLVILED